MSINDKDNKLQKAVEELSKESSLKGLFLKNKYAQPLPSLKALEEIIALLRAILFPGYYGHSRVSIGTLKYHIGVDLERLHKLLTREIMAGLCFVLSQDKGKSIEEVSQIMEHSEAIADEFISRLANVRDMLASDVRAMYDGDPAAESLGEIIYCYPCIKAIANYRIAHELALLQVPLIPRMITEMAHSETGIDIHPNATIGNHFCIDHGTGVVIGATCIIGNNVKIYQGVTLGAKSFPVDQNGNPIKGIPRHPILQDGVIVYSNATILGRITIGKGAVVGANMWITEDVGQQEKCFKTSQEG